jgi:succinate dehydrogenase / fumarate reductase, membrane anchor subunit
MATLINSLWDGLRYRGREPQWAFIFHRISGLAILSFLALHILDTATVYFAPSLYQHAIDLYRTPPFMLGEIALIAAIIFHGLNGYKIIYFDQKPLRWRKDNEGPWFWWICGITFVIWLPAAIIMGRLLYINNICQCPVPDTATAKTVFPAWFNWAIILSLVIGLIVVARMVNLKSGGAPRSFDTWMWLFMRWSGVLLVPLAWFHVMINDVLIGVHAITIDYVALRWATVGWRVYDFALLAFTFGHGMNGLRYVVNDYLHQPTVNKILNWVILIGWIVISALGAVAVIGGVRMP